MGKTMAKSDVIFGEDKHVELKSYESHQAEVERIILDSIGIEHLHDVNHSDVHSALAAALKDTLMREAHVKVGVIDGDLIWRAKAAKFTGEKEYDVVMVRHFAKYAAEQEEFVRDMFKEGSIHDQGGPLPRPAALEAAPARKTGAKKAPTKRTQVADRSEEFQARQAELKRMHGYFASLDADGAKEKLDGEPVGSWLVRASSGGGVTWSRREDDEAQPVKHWRIANQKDYNDFHGFIEGKGKGKQVTH